MITCDNWTDDETATRLLRVLEDRCLDYRCCVEALEGLVNEYMDATLDDKGRTECSKRLDLRYDAVCSQMRLILNELLEFERDLTAAFSGKDYRIEYLQQYLNEIAAPQEAAQ